MIVFHKNKFVDEKDVKISINSPGFQYGMGFFTSLKYCNCIVNYLDFHCERLYNSCKTFQIEFEKIDIYSTITELVKLNKLTEARIKIIIYVDEDKKGKYLIIPQQLAIHNSPKDILAVQANRGSNKLYQHKSLNYFENMFNKINCDKSKYDDFVLFNENGIILEAVTSNIFFMKNNMLITPKGSLPILEGIIRKVILGLDSIDSIESQINIAEISNYESCFLTNSIQGIIPIKSITYKDKRTIFNYKKIDKLPLELLNV